MNLTNFSSKSKENDINGELAIKMSLYSANVTWGIKFLQFIIIHFDKNTRAGKFVFLNWYLLAYPLVAPQREQLKNFNGGKCQMLHFWKTFLSYI